MNRRLSRLRGGEWLAAAASVLMLADLFVPAWFAAPAGRGTSVTAVAGQLRLNGWQTSLAVGVLALVACCGAVAVWLATAMRRSPALAVVLNTLLVPFSLALVLIVAIRVLVLHPRVHAEFTGSAATVSARAGAWAGLALSAALYAGLYIALRREGVASVDTPATIETLTLALPPGAPREEPHA